MNDHCPRSWVPPIAAGLLLFFAAVATAQSPDSATVAWRFSIPVGGQTTSTVTLVNRCASRHRFRIETTDANFASVEGVPDDGVRIAGGAEVERRVRFDAAGLRPALYRGELAVICTDCDGDLGCVQDRQRFGIEMTVTAPAHEVPDLGDVRVDEGVLVFADAEALTAALRRLGEIPTGPGRQRVLEAVEERLGHTSLRAVLEGRREELIQAGRLTDLADPDAHFVQDESLRVLLNEHGDLGVGSSIYHLWEPGLVVEVPTGEREVLERLHRGEIDPHAGSAEGFTVHAQPGKTDSTASCSADFSITVVTAGGVHFDNHSAGLQPITYLWDFGDGSPTVDEAKPVHAFPSSAPSTVCLSILDASGCIDTTCRTVNTSDCFAHFRAEVDGRKVTFTDSSLGDALNYSWTFGDGASSASASPTHTYGDSGDYLVCLRVTNGFGCDSKYCEFVELSKGECCDRNDRTKQKWTYFDGGRRRIKSVLWQTNLPFYHGWGARTKVEAQDAQGRWRPEKVDAVHALGGGTLYKRGEEGACSLPVPTDRDWSAVDASETHFSVYVGPFETFWTRQDSLLSIHYAVVDGQSSPGTFLSLSDDCARKNCKRSCRQGKKKCTTTCKADKKVCKSDCKSAKKSCVDGCSSLSGKAKRECKKACRKEKRSCTTKCRVEKGGCKKTCREGKKECKKACKS